MLHNSTEKRVLTPSFVYPGELPGPDHRTISLRAQLRLSYETYAWLRYLTWTGLALLGVLLLLVPGGIPPRVFLLFWQTLPLTSRLLAQHGSVALFSLATLAIQALTLLVLWGLWLAFSYTLARYTWQLARTRSLLGSGWLPSSALAARQEQSRELASVSSAKTAPLSLAALPAQLVAAQSGLQEPEHRTLSPLRAPRGDKASLRLLPPTPRGDGSPQPMPHASHSDSAASTTPRPDSQPRPRQFVQPTVPLVRRHAPSPAGEFVAGWPGGFTAGAPGVAWDVGITRKGRPNEDSVLTLRGTCNFAESLLPFELHIVADGMGGHAHGRLASHLALRGMLETVVPGLIACNDLEHERIVDILIDGVHWANQVIYQYGQERGTDMGTTITAALLLNQTAYIINVGDSRTYIYRPNVGLTQITRDHSLVARLVESGAISPDEVYTHPDRNKVYRGLGDKTDVTVDWFVLPVQSGDLLLLCSDGLWEMVRDPQMAEILTAYAGAPALASNVLLRAALHAGGNDNVSLLVVGCE